MRKDPAGQVMIGCGLAPIAGNRLQIKRDMEVDTFVELMHGFGTDQSACGGERNNGEKILPLLIKSGAVDTCPLLVHAIAQVAHLGVLLDFWARIPL